MNAELDDVCFALGIYELIIGNNIAKANATMAAARSNQRTVLSFTLTP
jgi:hypothetical protein